jgi:D-arabinose 1-dehydrogenase-like Zn-dependent alcohol dehydrogenase
MMPTRAWVSAKLARSDATRNVHCRAASSPPVTAGPLMAPMTGLPMTGRNRNRPLLSRSALRALRWGGRFVTVGYASGTVPRIPLSLVLLKGCRVLGFQFRDFAAHAPDELARNEASLFSLLACGQALPHIGATFTLAEAAAALRHVADGKAIGKVVLAIG